MRRDPKLRQDLLRDGLEAMLSGDIAVAKTILSDYINATVGFSGLAKAARSHSKLTGLNAMQQGRSWRPDCWNRVVPKRWQRSAQHTR